MCSSLALSVFMALGVLVASTVAQCRVTYTHAGVWEGGFQADVSITNLGSSAISGWTVGWTFSSGQQVSQAWNAQVTQSGTAVTARDIGWDGAIQAGGSVSFGFLGTTSGSNHAIPASFTLNGATCGGTTPPPPPPTTVSAPAPPGSTTAPGPSPPVTTNHPARSMGFIGCSMAENVAQGYIAIGGQRMWGPYGTGGAVVQSWTNPNSASWNQFNQQAAQYGRPTAVWVQICIFSQNGANMNEVRQLIANARQHAAAGATIYISGQPLYRGGQTCFLAGAGGPEHTDNLARQAAQDSSLNVVYAGEFWLGNGEVSDGCHANTAGQQALGRQALAVFG